MGNKSMQSRTVEHDYKDGRQASDDRSFDRNSQQQLCCVVAIVIDIGEVDRVMPLRLEEVEDFDADDGLCGCEVRTSSGEQYPDLVPKKFQIKARW